MEVDSTGKQVTSILFYFSYLSTCGVKENFGNIVKLLGSVKRKESQINFKKIKSMKSAEK